MDLAFLAAMFLCIALGVYALRVAADRDRWREEAERLRSMRFVPDGVDVSFRKSRKRK